MDYSEYEQLKRELLDAKEKAMSSQITEAQAKLYDDIIERLLIRLKGDEIANTSMNVAQLSTIDKIWADFVKKEMVPIMEDYVVSLSSINELNKEYFSAFAKTKEIINQISETIDKRTFNRLGVETNGTLTKNGYIESLIMDDTIKREVKKLTYKAIVSDKITKQEYIASVKTLIKGTPDINGALERHFETFAYDTFTQHDRDVSQQYAKRLGLKYARYAGGLVEDSRPFCVVRNNKVFTSEEISKFGTSQDTYGGYTNKAEGKFRGKPNEYDPVLDCGGYRCRHTLNFISYERAKELRPDL